MPFAADLAAADGLALEHLGEPVSYVPQFSDQAGTEVVGLFFESYLRSEVVGGVAVESTSPAVWLRLADLPTDPDEDDARIVRAGKTYRIREVQPDGTGAAMLLLTEVP